jgi:hypothetical protein
MRRKVLFFLLIFIALFMGFFLANAATTKTIVTPSKTITKTVMVDKVLKDSDRDGIIDDEDPHPNIAEIYIVRDDNLNGIDDNYEF